VQESVTERRGRRRTFVLGVLSGAFVIAAFRLMDPSVVLAVLADRLTGSKALVGLLIAGFTVGSQIPGLLMPWVLEGHRAKLGWYRVAGGFRILTLLSVALLLFSPVPHRAPTAAFWLLSLGLLLATLWAGVQFIPFMDVIAKSVPATRRGAYWGYREVGGGVLALGSAALVSYCLDDARPYPFPVGYAWIFAAVTGLIVISVTLFSCTWEPPDGERERRMSLRMHLARGPRLMRRDLRFAPFVLTRALLDLSLMGGPFVALLGRERLGLSDGDIAFLLVPVSLAAIPLPFLWGTISDRLGTRSLWRVASLLAVGHAGVAGLLVLVGPVAHEPALWLLGVSLLLGGAARASGAMGMQNHVLDLAPPTQRDTYVGFNNVLGIPLAFASVLAGGIGDALGLGMLYAVAFVLGLGAVAGAFLRLAEPRASGAVPSPGVASRRHLE